LLRRLPAHIRFPDFDARTRPSDSLFAFGRGSGCPSPWAYLGADAVLGGRRVRPRTRRPRGLVTGSPRRRTSLGANRASQVTGPSSYCVPCFQTPPGALATGHFQRSERFRLQQAWAPGHPGWS